MVVMGQGATGMFENNSQEPTLGCGTSLAPSPERLSVESRRPGEERAGCVQQGKGLTSVFLRGGREGGSTPGLVMADKALREQEVLTEVRMGTGRRWGEAVPRKDRPPGRVPVNSSELYSVSSSWQTPNVSFTTTSSK